MVIITLHFVNSVILWLNVVSQCQGKAPLLIHVYGGRRSVHGIWLNCHAVLKWFCSIYSFLIECGYFPWAVPPSRASFQASCATPFKKSWKCPQFLWFTKQQQGLKHAQLKYANGNDNVWPSWCKHATPVNKQKSAL